MVDTRRRRASVIIIGAGGHGKVVCDALAASGCRVVGWVDDRPALRGQAVYGKPVLGTRKALPSILRRLGTLHPKFVVAIGDNERRGRIFDELVSRGLSLVNVIHPRSVVAPSVRLGDGIVVCAGAVVNPDTMIGDNVIINTAVTVDHDNRIERDAHLSPGAHTGGHVHLGRGVHIGLGAVVLPDLRIGAATVVGAGAVVDRDLPGGVVAVGVPARVVHRVS